MPQAGAAADAQQNLNGRQAYPARQTPNPAQQGYYIPPQGYPVPQQSRQPQSMNAQPPYGAGPQNQYPVRQMPNPGQNINTQPGYPIRQMPNPPQPPLSAPDFSGAQGETRETPAFVSENPVQPGSVPVLENTVQEMPAPQSSQPADRYARDRFAAGFSSPENFPADISQGGAPDLPQAVSPDDPLSGYGMQPVGGTSEKKSKRLSGKIIALIAGAAALVIIAAVLIPVLIHNAKQSKYNEGMAYLENGQYSEAAEIFTSLGSFNDSEQMADFARIERDYAKIDSLADAEQFDSIVGILNARSDYYGDTEKGREAKKLAGEYKKLSEAFAAKNSGDYDRAANKLDDLDTLREKYSAQRCLCLAHAAEEEHNWIDILLNLYAIQSGDADYDFLENPQDDDDAIAAGAYYTADPYRFDQVITPLDEETRSLKDTAITGLKYDEAKKQLDSGSYIKAMELFGNLGDFLDSKECLERAKEGYESYKTTYAQAEEYFNNGEFYKAKKLFMQIPEYEDSSQRAETCVQELPENGAFKTGSGSGVNLKIVAPKGSRSVYIKIYNSDRELAGKVFLRPEKSSTLKLKSGTYYMNVAYGTEWYGETDLFGDEGTYQQLLNGTSDSFKLSSGYTYTLELLSKSNGNVGSKNVGGASGM